MIKRLKWVRSDTLSSGSLSRSFIGKGRGEVKSFIGSGLNNTLSGNYNAILGGQGNTISAGYDHVGIFGKNITNVRSNTFHTNCLNACDTPGPGAPGGAFPGTVYWDHVGCPGKALYIV